MRVWDLGLCHRHTDRTSAFAVKKAWDVRDRLQRLRGAVADVIGKLDPTCSFDTQGGRSQCLVEVMPPRRE